MKKSELTMKDVIDVSTGKKLGFINDVEIDIDQGKIRAIIVPSHQNRVFSFFSKKQDLTIDWKDIQKIGEDVILVSG